MSFHKTTTAAAFSCYDPDDDTVTVVYHSEHAGIIRCPSCNAWMRATAFAASCLNPLCRYRIPPAERKPV